MVPRLDWGMPTLMGFLLNWCLNFGWGLEQAATAHTKAILLLFFVFSLDFEIVSTLSFARLGDNMTVDSSHVEYDAVEYDDELIVDIIEIFDWHSLRWAIFSTTETGMLYSVDSLVAISSGASRILKDLVLMDFWLFDLLVLDLLFLDLSLLDLWLLDLFLFDFLLLVMLLFDLLFSL